MVRLSFILGLVLACLPAITMAGSLAYDINNCIKTIESENKKGKGFVRVELEFYCPGTLSKIRRSHIAPLLTSEYDSVSSVDDLKDIRHFLHVTRKPLRNLRQLDYAGLDTLLENTFRKEAPPPQSLWDQFMTWLKQFFPEQQEEDYSWLTDFLNSIEVPDWVLELIFDGSMVLVVVLALAVLVNEWRYYRQGGTRRRKRALKTPAKPEDHDYGATLSFDNICSLPLASRLPALLNKVIASLIKAGDLPTQRSFTNRELLRTLYKGRHQYSEYFAQLATASESVVYGNIAPTEGGVAGLIDGARQLLEPSSVKP